MEGFFLSVFTFEWPICFLFTITVHILFAFICSILFLRRTAVFGCCCCFETLANEQVQLAIEITNKSLKRTVTSFCTTTTTTNFTRLIFRARARERKRERKFYFYVWSSINCCCCCHRHRCRRTDCNTSVFHRCVIFSFSTFVLITFFCERYARTHSQTHSQRAREKNKGSCLNADWRMQKSKIKWQNFYWFFPLVLCKIPKKKCTWYWRSKSKQSHLTVATKFVGRIEKCGNSIEINKNCPNVCYPLQKTRMNMIFHVNDNCVRVRMHECVLMSVSHFIHSYIHSFKLFESVDLFLLILTHSSAGLHSKPILFHHFFCCFR